MARFATMLLLVLAMAGAVPDAAAAEGAPPRPVVVDRSAPPATIEIASYNVQFAMPDLISHLIREWPGHKPNVAARARAIAARLACFDVVGLQEVVSDRRRRQLLDALEVHGRACGKPSRLPSGRLFMRIDGPDPPGPGLPPIDDVLALASRLPVVAAGAHVFEHHSIGESVVAKGVLHARLERAPGDVIDVFVTHLQADRERAAVRRRQIEELASFVRERAASPTSPIVLMGDFNIWGGDPDRADPGSEYHRLLRTLNQAVAPRRFADLWLTTHADDPETASGTKSRVLKSGRVRPHEKRIDYVFAAGDLTAQAMRRDFFPSGLVVDGVPVGTLSNHAALLATVRWAPDVGARMVHYLP